MGLKSALTHNAHNNYKKTSRNSSKCSSINNVHSKSVSHNIVPVNNINNVYINHNPNNNHTYPTLSPPQLVVLDEGEKQDHKRISTDETTRILPSHK